MEFRAKRRVAFVIPAVILALVALSLPAAADLNLVAEDPALVAYTEGDGVNVRDAADADAGVVTTLPEGFAVTIDSGPTTAADGSNWYAVTAETSEGTVSGWVLADYLTGANATADTETVTDTDAMTTFGGVQMQVNTGGDNLNVRSDASTSAEVLVEAPAGVVVEVLAPAITDADGIAWTMVSYDGVVGYSASAYLTALGTDVAVDDAATDAALASTGVFTIGGTAAVAGTGGDGVNQRSDATVDAEILALLSDGALVQILDGPSVDANGDAWYQVDAAGTAGWVHGAYLTGIPSAISAALLAGDQSLGVSIAAGSLVYLGAPWVDGGADIDGFDAPGLVWRVINQDLGVTFPATLAEQSISGGYVTQTDLIPGDLVFFQDTVQPGLSHVGIYLGDGQFTGSSSERGAVTIENLSDPYWAASYLTARRVNESTAEPAG